MGESDLPQVLPLMRAYCDFYAVNPSDDDLMSLARALIAHPEREGVQLIARDGGGASKIGVMNDLYVVSEARGTGVADALIAECSTLCRVHGARELAWQTAKDNYRAQAVYDRVGAVRAEWLDYSLPV